MGVPPRDARGKVCQGWREGRDASPGNELHASMGELTSAPPPLLPEALTLPNRHTLRARAGGAA
jgi:hypothetical protein